MPTINQQGQHVDSQYFINNLNITKLSQLDDIDEATKRRLLSLYEEQVGKSPRQAKYQLALGLFYLDRRLYSRAVKSLEVAHDRDPLDADVLYYLALALISGRQPAVLRFSTIQQIEECIRGAIEIDDHQAHLFYLWALIKYEYYLVNGLKDSPPAIEELVTLAQKRPLSASEVRHMLEHIQVADNPVVDMLLDKCHPSKQRRSLLGFLQKQRA